MVVFIWPHQIVDAFVLHFFFVNFINFNVCSVCAPVLVCVRVLCVCIEFKHGYHRVNINLFNLVVSISVI
jgi:hypothetical protein